MRKSLLPATLEDTFCMFFCTDAGLERLQELLADEANDARPIVPDLYGEAGAFQLNEYLKPRLTAEAVATLGLDPADDPGFLECEPWAFAREIFAPHQLQVEQVGDRVELLYGEWTIRRTIYLDGRKPRAGEASTPMGHSVGHYEGSALVVETTHIAANFAPGASASRYPSRSTGGIATNSAPSSVTRARRTANGC